MAAAVSAEKQSGHRSGFIAAWLGWAFDGLDGMLYPLVAVPFVMELLGPGATVPQAAAKAGLIQAIFLVGWAIGGLVFGRIGDALGRSRTLTLTIVTYAAFTGLSFFAHEWWHLAVFRFLAALGIGGEWAAGSALVSETLPARYRPWGSAMLQTGYMIGIILAALTVGSFAGFHSYRYVFLVGVLPAVVTIWIRRSVPEPEEWAGERTARKMPKISDLFGPEVRKATLFTLAVASLALTCSWTLIYFSTQVLRGLPEVKAMAKPAVDDLVRSVTIAYSIWNIVGNFLAAAMARYIGYRRAFIVMAAGGLVAYVVGFAHPRPLDEFKIWMNLSAVFGLGLFALFPLYLPPLFPTLLRTTGAGFGYNFGRIVAAAGTLYLAMSTAGAVSPHQAIYLSGLLFIPIILLAFFMPVLKEGT
ncbi:MFS transporter [Fimbriimonas ginsengisoli]|uniref:Major facilitator superfamily MFS_1 n=1 Tax=Fimbriimonas ginsengisoli Gsoil 348 TaxID=661478 RepID=A0A068NN38_FIMGI|nr:MFS transporter [Fimbriimonas ginsengisoli]AIE84973.1 major facilitator superfamily MFS_1 [Fimbriimonas ginsengisoli Gsoil 348]